MTRIAYFIGGSMDMTKRAESNYGEWPRRSYTFARVDPLRYVLTPLGPAALKEGKVLAVEERYVITGRSCFAPDTYFYAYEGEKP